MTVKELYEKCKKEIENGNGSQEIVLCVNYDEFHTLTDGFSSPADNDSILTESYLKAVLLEEDEVIVLN